jgi:predicted TIM-barrel fold metal-dependent hydrolase
VSRVAGRGWAIGINAGLAMLESVALTLAAVSERVVIDHFANPRADKGVEQPGFVSLLSLLALSHVHVKLSAPYVISSNGPGYEDVDAFARTLVAAAPDRIVWGSNWPHTQGSHGRAGAKPTDIEPFRDEDNVRNFAMLTRWVPDEAARAKILVDNPARLFGFD